MQPEQKVIDFTILRSASEAFYKTLVPLKCPALKAEVHFTSEGFNHLRYKSHVPRTEAAQARKFKSLRKAPEIIGLTTTIQEYRRGVVPIGKTGKDGFRKTAEAEYWGFAHVFGNNVRIRVIVRKVGNGNHHFWSVMPSWKEVAVLGGKYRRTGGDDMETE